MTFETVDFENNNIVVEDVRIDHVVKIEPFQIPMQEENKSFWKCNICDSEMKNFVPFFKSKNYLDLHIATIHDGKLKSVKRKYEEI